MKKALFFLIMIASLIPLAFSAELKDQMKTIELRGSLDSYCTIYVESLSTTSAKPDEGLPFDIMEDPDNNPSIDSDNSVKYKGDHLVDGNLIKGRKVAEWSLATNSLKKSLTIKASPFTHENGITKIDYYISFEINYDDDEGVAQKRYYTVDTSSVGSEGKTFPIECTGSVVSMEKPVLLMFREYTDPERNSWPNGYYTATVSFVLTGN